MTTRPETEHLTPGIYRVQDSAIRRKLSALLAPMLVDASTVADGGIGSGEYSDAVARTAELTGTPSAVLEGVLVEELIDHVHRNRADQVDALSESLAHARTELDAANEALNTERAAHAVTRGEAADARTAVAEELAQKSARLTELEVDLEHTRAELAQARDDLAGAKKLTDAATQPLHGNSARAKDRKAWVGVSEWIEREASSQGSEAAKVMRIIRREVDREITKLYGETGKAAS